MSTKQFRHTARDRINAVMLVYNNILTVSEVCDKYVMSRPTWYEWEKQLKDAIQPVWGGLARKS